MKEKNIGKKVIIRAQGAGVFFGTLVARDGQEVELKDVRRIWRWEGAASLSQLATEGTSNPSGCRFTVIVPSMEVLGVIEVIPCTDRAIESIEGVPVWRA